MRYKNQPYSAEQDIVVDLSEHANALMEYEDISDMLTEDQETKLIDYVRACTKMSFERISGRHQHWQDADRAHDVWVPADSTKFREKAVVAEVVSNPRTPLTPAHETHRWRGTTSPNAPRQHTLWLCPHEMRVEPCHKDERHSKLRPTSLLSRP